MVKGVSEFCGDSHRCSPKNHPQFIMDFFELYYAYLAWCKKDNWANMRDPNHDYMEWNHTLPRCIFGDQPVGQWLTIKQHAIASALQTLAFKEKCVCGFHKELMPAKLWELCLPYTQSWGAILGLTYGVENVALGRGLWSQTPEQWANTQRKGGETAGKMAVELKLGIHVDDPEKRREWASSGGARTKGKLWWNNGVKNKRSVECPGEGWKPGLITNRWTNK
jgi:hypothetical protein